MAIMGIIRMLVPRTATTVLTTLWVAYLWGPARGITAFMDVATTVAGTTVAASTVEATMAAAGITAGAATIATGMGADLIAAIAVATVVVAVFTEAAASMEGAVSMAAGTAADAVRQTFKRRHFACRGPLAGEHFQPLSFL